MAKSLLDSVATLVYLTTPSAMPEMATKRKVFARLNDYFDRRAQARYVSQMCLGLLITYIYLGC